MWPAASPTYEPHYLWKRLAGAAVDNHVGEAVEGRGLCVHHDHRRTRAQGDQGDLGRRIDDQRGTDDEHHVGLTGQGERLRDGFRRHRLAEKHDRRFEPGSATRLAAWRHLELETLLNFRAC